MKLIKIAQGTYEDQLIQIDQQITQAEQNIKDQQAVLDQYNENLQALRLQRSQLISLVQQNAVAQQQQVQQAEQMVTTTPATVAPGQTAPVAPAV